MDALNLLRNSITIATKGSYHDIHHCNSNTRICILYDIISGLSYARSVRHFLQYKGRA